MKIQFISDELQVNGFIDLEDREIYFSQWGALYTLAPVERSVIPRGTYRSYIDPNAPWWAFWVMCDGQPHVWLLVEYPGHVYQWYMCTLVQENFYGYEGV